VGWAASPVPRWGDKKLGNQVELSHDGTAWHNSYVFVMVKIKTEWGRGSKYSSAFEGEDISADALGFWPHSCGAIKFVLKSWQDYSVIPSPIHQIPLFHLYSNGTGRHMWVFKIDLWVKKSRDVLLLEYWPKLIISESFLSIPLGQFCWAQFVGQIVKVHILWRHKNYWKYEKVHTHLTHNCNL
jgi:hypothetical protein